MRYPVILALTLAEAEALALLLAEHAAEWRTLASEAGVEAPDELAARVVVSHRNGVARVS